MKQSVKDDIDSLLDFNEQYYETLKTRINNFIISIEYNDNPDSIAKDNIKWQLNEIKEWMNTYHLMVDNSVDSIYDKYIE